MLYRLKKLKNAEITIACIIVMVCVSVFISPAKESIFASEAELEMRVSDLEVISGILKERADDNLLDINALAGNGYLTEDSFVVQSFSLDNQTISASGYKSIAVSSSVTKDGYTAKGIVGYTIANGSTSGANCSYCVVNRCYLSGSTAYVLLRNTSSSAAVVKPVVYVLFVKNT